VKYIHPTAVQATGAAAKNSNPASTDSIFMRHNVLYTAGSCGITPKPAQ
jgi:hypothetical protein